MTFEDLTALNSIHDDLSRLVIADYFADKDMTWIERELRNPVPSNETPDRRNSVYGDAYGADAAFGGHGGGGYDGGGYKGDGGSGTRFDGRYGCGDGGSRSFNSAFQRFSL